MVNYNPLVAKIGIALFALVALFTSYSSASGLGWILNGNVINAATCAPIVGANVSSPYNNYAFNLTNAKGNYSLVLGTGNWSVTVKASGYEGGNFLTPYESNGGHVHNFALLPVGGVAGRCLSGISNETIINSTKTTITPGVNPNVTTSVAAYTTSIAASSGSVFPASTAVVVIIVIIIIVIVAYALTRNSKKKTHTS
jgi:hypothetical protein